MSSKPTVAALALAGDLEGLRAATEYQDRLREDDGTIIDVGVPIREQAVLALGDLAGTEVDDAVADALTDPSDRVRLAAVRVCAQRGDAALLATAVGSIPPGDGEARVLAITELLGSGELGMSRLLAEALVYRVGDDPVGEEDVLLLDTALEIEGRPNAHFEVIDAAIDALGDESDDIADRAETILAHLAPASVGPLLEELERGPAAGRAASALGRTKDVRALGPLIEALERPDAELRAECCVALGELRDPAAVDVLLRATRDPEHIVRAQAGWALDYLGTPAVVVGVSTLLQPMIAQLASGGGSRGREALEDGSESRNGDGNSPRAPGAGQRPSLAAGAVSADAADDHDSMLRRLARLLDHVDDLRRGSSGSGRGG